jgi:hypothetical protein
MILFLMLYCNYIVLLIINNTKEMRILKYENLSIKKESRSFLECLLGSTSS